MRNFKKNRRLALSFGFLAFIVITGYGVLSYPFLHSRAASEGRASLFLGPSGGTFTVGSTFNVSLYLNTGGQFVNAVEAYLAFPPDKIQIVSPTTGKSFIQVWTNQPTYSNRNGTLSFQGGVHNPGINTDSGIISTITFRVKETGAATIKILDNSRVFLADGFGTDVLSERSGGVYALALPPPAGPIVSSPTNPDQEKWYANNNIVFRWEAPPDVQGYSFALSTAPVDDLDSISEGIRTSASYQDLPDGIYYFHIKSLRAGVWGGVTSYQIKNDRTPPAQFEIEISPNSYTSNQRPIFAFQTTDAGSGIDHYEFRTIPLDAPSGLNSAKTQDTSFFIEVDSPYSEKLNVGRYDVVARASDKAGNLTQSQTRLTIVSPTFEIVRDRGLRLWGSYVIEWPYVWGGGALLFVLLAYLGLTAWRKHGRVKLLLDAGALQHPDILQKFNELIEKQKQYKNQGKPPAPGAAALVIWGLLFALACSALYSPRALGAEASLLNPPIANLFPESISNEEIFYIGGRTDTPGATVIINIQRSDTGSTLSETAETDSKGEWFHSHGEFLRPGIYKVWTQLKEGNEVSQPSPELILEVEPTAVQIGKYHLSIQEFYLILLVVLGALFILLLAFTLYHSYHERKKRLKFVQELQAAEESIRRGFSVLRRDIQAELAIVRRAKLNKELAVEEKIREEKLLKDLEWVNDYIGKEIWEIEESEKNRR